VQTQVFVAALDNIMIITTVISLIAVALAFLLRSGPLPPSAPPPAPAAAPAQAPVEADEPATEDRTERIPAPTRS
jgi:hypothetical protein